MLAEIRLLRGLGAFRPAPARGKNEPGDGIVVDADEVNLRFVRVPLFVRNVKGFY
ncbi:hypothetical protein D9M69_694580 [compost metagenome]